MAIAMVNIPGSQFFNYFKGSVKECKQWLSEITAKAQDKTNVFPQRIISNQKAKYLKWPNGGGYILPRNLFDSTLPQEQDFITTKRTDEEADKEEREWRENFEALKAKMEAIY